ncbi:MAG: hypothetical protein ACM65K_11580 [Microcoleus sp.]
MTTTASNEPTLADVIEKLDKLLTVSGNKPIAQTHQTQQTYQTLAYSAIASPYTNFPHTASPDRTKLNSPIADCRNCIHQGTLYLSVIGRLFLLQTPRLVWETPPSHQPGFFILVVIGYWLLASP